MPATPDEKPLDAAASDPNALPAFRAVALALMG